MNETRKRISKSAIVLFALAAAVLAPDTTWAQDQCQAFHAVGQWHLDTATPNYWGGDVFGSLNGTVLIGKVVFVSKVTLPRHGVTGMDGSGTRYRYEFPEGTFTVELQSPGVYPSPPGKLAYYTEVAKIVEGSGTGIFANASGMIASSGPYFVWPDSGRFLGRYNAEHNGNICNVAP